jgi:SAM-dependent methyltransferase
MNDSAARIEALQRQYGSRDPLQVRVRTHQMYSQPQVDFPAWALDQTGWLGDEIILDLGCGTGFYRPAAVARGGRYIALDLFPAMLRGLGPPFPERINADASRLPLHPATLDVVLANHLLFLLPEPGPALAEIRRVLRPGGRLLAATNSVHTMPELYELRRQAAETLGARLPKPGAESPVRSFSLENGAAILEGYFEQVERRILPSAFVFPGPEPVVDYLASMGGAAGGSLPDGLAWESFAAELRRVLRAHFAAHDTLHVNKISGLFLCRKQT